MTIYSAAIFAGALALAATGLRAQPSTRGTLHATNGQGVALADCPLKHTAVKAEVSGMVARVNVVQEFQNPMTDKIEAVYVFPLPHDAAVDSMTMQVGGRTIEGRIKRREEARDLYRAAREAGHVASLLDQERPNVFTQSVANVLPGENVRVAISYVQILKYDAGSYEFVFPMVVAPRYIPGSAVGRQAGGRSPDTHLVPDGSRITPQVAPPGTRAGHDISLEVEIDAGLPVGDVASRTHDVDVQWYSSQRARVRLRDEQTIPNKDFILRYKSAGQTMRDAVLAHHSAKGGFFTLILQPPDKIGPPDTAPKELIFLLDTSGSMSGFPIEKAKESLLLALDGLYPQDTFNLITFSGDTEILFPMPVPATAENMQTAKLFLQSRSGRGGTEMMQAIRAALEPAVGSGRVRIVCFMTDGEVGNDMTILAEVRKHPATRVFAFGIGQSVNRFLLDGVARLGHGAVEYVGLHDDGSAAARRFHERVRNPLLTDLTIDWGGLAVTDVSPAQIPDLFGAGPVLVTGRYAGAMRGAVKLRGKVGGRDVARDIALDLPGAEARHDVLATLWARARIEDLLAQDYAGAQHGVMSGDLKEQITKLGLDFRLATQFTSFVAVEEQMVTSGTKSRRVEVPVNMPEGMRHEGLFGAPGGVVGGVHGGVVGGVPGGVLGGIIGSVPSAAPPPPPPPPPPVMKAETPAAPARISIGGNVQQSKLLRQPMPVYPPLAAQARISGVVRLAAVISTSGAVRDLQVISGHPLLVAAALDAVKQWVYQPTILNGEPVEIRTEIDVSFTPASVVQIPGGPERPEPGKLDPELAALAKGADRSIRVTVQVLLRDASTATMARLQQLDFEVLQPAGPALLLIGRIEAGRLEELSGVPAVRYVVKRK